MKLLLDTHIFLWFISGDDQLPAPTLRAIRDESNEVFLSVVSVWEVMLKYGLGKLPMPEPPERFLPAQRERHRIASLALTEEGAVPLATLPALHRDPFDRMLVSQSIAHGLILVTEDHIVKTYPVTVFTGA
jgi:PIN domain nuclease of toxin-antitoxin system